MVQEVNQFTNKIKEVKYVFIENASIGSKTNKHGTKYALGWGLLHWGLGIITLGGLGECIQ